MKTRSTLNILHLTDGNRGGSQRHIIDLCRGDMAHVRHFVFRVSAESVSIHDAVRDRVLALDAASVGNGGKSFLETLIAELSIGCVHVHAMPALFASIAAGGSHLGDIPQFVTLHDLTCIDPHLFKSPTVEADLLAIKQRNAHVEQTSATLHNELAASHELVTRIERELAEQRERALRLERALAKLPFSLGSRLSSHV
ncbi:MAG: hypothetical protein ABI648_12090 [Betaproteobacteria bacterium]